MLKNPLGSCHPNPLRSLRKWLHKLGYAVRERNMKWKVYERMDVVAARHKFLQDIRKYRSLGYTILYQDETWRNAQHTQQYIWMCEENSDTFINCLRYKGGYDVPLGKGTRSIVCASGGKKGFVEETSLCFVGNSKSEDYHGKMNSAHFEEKVLPNIEDKTVIVIDNAQCHSNKQRNLRDPIQVGKRKNAGLAKE